MESIVVLLAKDKFSLVQYMCKGEGNLYIGFKRVRGSSNYVGFTPNACIFEINMSILSSASTLIDLIRSTISGTSRSLSYPFDDESLRASKEFDRP